jgi:bifunctional NMN adenylyltransferase/nudix hydrolase
MQKVGVIVGRFQVPELHVGHRYLIETVAKECDLVFIVLGVAETPSGHDPFSVATRTTTLQTAYPNVHIAEIADHPSDTVWSTNLDHIINNRFPKTEITLFGSRKSFLEQYCGTFETVFIAPVPSPSGTEVRKKFFSQKTNSA